MRIQITNEYSDDSDLKQCLVCGKNTSINADESVILVLQFCGEKGKRGVIFCDLPCVELFSQGRTYKGEVKK